MLLYLSLILCLLQNMYQADWHRPVSPGVFTCTTAYEAEIRHGANLTIYIQIAIPETILSTRRAEALTASEQRACPQADMSNISESLTLHISCGWQIDYGQLRIVCCYLNTVVRLARQGVAGLPFQITAVYDVLEHTILGNSETLRQMIDDITASV